MKKVKKLITWNITDSGHTGDHSKYGSIMLKQMLRRWSTYNWIRIRRHKLIHDKDRNACGHLPSLLLTIIPLKTRDMIYSYTGHIEVMQLRYKIQEGDSILLPEYTYHPVQPIWSNNRMIFSMCWDGETTWVSSRKSVVGHVGATRS